MPRRTFTKLALLTLAATLLLLALLPAGASAYMSPGEPVVDPKVDRWLAVARATWDHAPVCPEGVRVDRRLEESLPGVRQAPPQPQPAPRSRPSSGRSRRG